jgi:hypothetical protein
VSDLKRLRQELRILYEAIEADLEERHPEWTRQRRWDAARTRLLSLVDEAVQDVTAEY